MGNVLCVLSIDGMFVRQQGVFSAQNNGRRPETTLPPSKALPLLGVAFPQSPHRRRRRRQGTAV